MIRPAVARIAAAAAASLLGSCGERPEPANEVGKPAAPAPSQPARAPAAPPPAAPRTGPWSSTGYALVGTDPFWGGSLTGTTLRYMVPEDQFGDVIETRAAFAPDRETYSGSWRSRPFVLTLRRGPCSDGRSEQIYAFAAELLVLGETRRGCADPQ